MLICLNKQETFFKNVALTIAMPSKNMMLVTEIYKTLKQGQLVSTLEEYSVHWLNKHKTTASYLIHKKRDLSLNAKINCLKNLKNKIIELENVNCFIKNLNNQNIIDLKQVINLIQNNIKLEFDLDIN